MLDSVLELNKERGNRLRECRKQKGLTQEQLADLAELSIQHISLIENGKRGMSLESVKKFCSILEVRERYLLCEDNFKTTTDAYWGDDKASTTLSDGITSFYQLCGLDLTDTCVITQNECLHVFPPRAIFPILEIDGQEKYIIYINNKPVEITNIYQKVTIDGTEYTLNEKEFAILNLTITNAAKSAIKSFGLSLNFINEERNALYQQLDAYEKP